MKFFLHNRFDVDTQGDQNHPWHDFEVSVETLADFQER
jgi:hypothetical protein